MTKGGDVTIQSIYTKLTRTLRYSETINKLQTT